MSGLEGYAISQKAAAKVQQHWWFEGISVGDVMTTRVVSVPENAPFKDIVAALARSRVSAVPVVNSAGQVVGVVSESDLLAKVVAGGDPQARTAGSPPIGTHGRKSHAETAAELMSAPATTTRPDASVVDAARIAALGHVRRLPVVDGRGVLVGIVTRSDLLSVFLRDDDELRDHIRDLATRGFLLDPASIDVSVADGVVTVTGHIDHRSRVAPLLDAVRGTAGVVGVHDDLTYAVDDIVVLPVLPD